MSVEENVEASRQDVKAPALANQEEEKVDVVKYNSAGEVRLDYILRDRGFREKTVVEVVTPLADSKLKAGTFWTIGEFDLGVTDTPGQENILCSAPTGACCVGDPAGDYCVPDLTMHACNLLCPKGGCIWHESLACEDIGCGLGECLGDYDGSGTVDVADLLLVISDWGNPYDVSDLLQVISDWGCGG